MALIELTLLICIHYNLFKQILACMEVSAWDRHASVPRAMKAYDVPQNVLPVRLVRIALVNARVKTTPHVPLRTESVRARQDGGV